MIQVTQNILKDIYKNREKEVKKYDFGLLFVIGGSDFYSGSPAISAMAASRAGVDMVRIIAPERAANIIASFSPTLAAYPLEGKWLEKNHLATLISMVKAGQAVSNNKTAVVIGGGLGRTEETQEAILEFISLADFPLVIDADAIHAVGKNTKVLAGKNFLITPHTYEFFVLTGKKVFDLPLDEKIKIVQEEAARLQSTILLKGVIDIISDGKEVALNKTGSPYMTKGGTGDSLAGICGALLARGLSPFISAQAGAFINGKAGELASQKLRDGFLATDLIEAIPAVFKK